jgi:hypothetical protein
MRSPALPLAFAVLAALLVPSLTTTDARAQEDRRVPAPVKRPERDESWLFFDFYTRASITTMSVNGLTDSASSFDLGVATTISTGREKMLQGIYEADLAIGGGDADLNGVARMYGWVGLSPAKRGPVRPFLRLGTGFDFRGNDYFLHSHADIPAAQLGVRLLRSELTVDGGAFSAYTGTGRFDVNGNERKLDGALAWGGFLDARSEDRQWPFLAHAEFRSYGDTLASPGVRAWSLKACLVQWEIAIFCLDGTTASGAINDGTGVHDAWAFSGGLTAGLGVLQPTRDL